MGTTGTCWSRTTVPPPPPPPPSSSTVAISIANPSLVLYTLTAPVTSRALASSCGQALHEKDTQKDDTLLACPYSHPLFPPTTTKTVTSTSIARPAPFTLLHRLASHSCLQGDLSQIQIQIGCVYTRVFWIQIYPDSPMWTVTQILPPGALINSLLCTQTLWELRPVHTYCVSIDWLISSHITPAKKGIVPRPNCTLQNCMYIAFHVYRRHVDYTSMARLNQSA